MVDFRQVIWHSFSKDMAQVWQELWRSFGKEAENLAECQQSMEEF